MINPNDVIFFTGAGISVESGIPTFSEQEGLRDKLTREFALTHKDEYRETIKNMCDICDKATPNEAHKAIAEFGCRVITMNIDNLHQRAGSKDVLAVHGRLPYPHELYADNFNELLGLPILYGDNAPLYDTAYKEVKNLEYGKCTFVVVGTSFYTAISEQLVRMAMRRRASVITINQNATIEVPKLIKRFMED